MVGKITEAIIIGCGSMGERHAKNLKELGINAVAFADPRLGSVTNNPMLYADSLECIRNHAKERLVVIASPNYAHAEQAIEACYAGAGGIFVEKPVAVTGPDAWHLLEVASDNNVKVVVGHNFRLHPGIHKLIGNVIHPNFWFTAIGIDDITTWPSYKNLGKESYLHDKTGGVLWTSGSHAVDLAIFLHGEVAQVLTGQSDDETTMIVRCHHIGGGISVLYNKWAVDHPQNSVLTYMSPADSVIVDLLERYPQDMHKQLMFEAVQYFNNDLVSPNLPLLDEAVHGVDVLLAAERSFESGKAEEV
ncbi:MAG: Gfo/Idh/MocA family protein [Candidatus Thorarchaeota archaeon]|jgi:predicted dehydrogenase